MKKRSSKPNREQRLNEVLLGYVEATQEGHAPDRNHLLAAHPDLQPELLEFFANHDAVERLAAPLRYVDRQNLSNHDVGIVQSRESTTGELGQLGDFRILREVGRGGMGVVYEAEQISLRRRVALKVLPFAAAIDSRQLQRFRNEALAAAHLRHENVVPVYAVGSERGVHYYAMQFVEGQSLATLIADLRRRADESSTRSSIVADTTGPYFAESPAATQTDFDLDPVAESISHDRTSGSRRYYDWVAGLGRQAAAALEHAHQMGVVHRDIKPANLLLDSRGQLWVADFGLAQFSNDVGLTGTGELLGTLRYASPEQVRARPGVVDQRSDVYSLGATLYELLTLRPIFDGRDRAELLRQIANDDPQPLRAIDRAIPVELETIILKALAKDPSERYATARDFAEDLQCFRDDRPIRARRPSFLEHAIKWARRHRAVVVSAFAGLMLSLAGLAVATVLAASAYERERIKANEAAEQRSKAEESFRQARRAVDQFVQIGAEDLAGDPALEGARRVLLEAALAYYRDFIDQRRDDPTVQADLEQSWTKVNAIRDELITLIGAGQYALLQEPSVQDDIGLSMTQRAALARLDARWRDLLDGPVRRGNRDEQERKRLTLAQEQETVVVNLFSAEQFQRFRQIALQHDGPRAFADAEVAEALRLTNEQKRRIRDILAEAGFNRALPDPHGEGRRMNPPPDGRRNGPPGEGRKGGPPDGRKGGPPDGRKGGPKGEGRKGGDNWKGPPDFPRRGFGPDPYWDEDRHARAQRARETQSKILETLTPEQIKEWEKLVGRPFVGEFRRGGPRRPPP